MTTSQVRFTDRTRPQALPKTPGIVAASFVILSNVAILALFAVVALGTALGWFNF